MTDTTDTRAPEHKTTVTHEGQEIEIVTRYQDLAETDWGGQDDDERRWWTDTIEAWHEVRVSYTEATGLHPSHTPELPLRRQAHEDMVDELFDTDDMTAWPEIMARHTASVVEAQLREERADVARLPSGGYLVAETGMAQDPVQVGIGSCLAETWDNLSATPIQSQGPDSGLRSAVEWALSENDTGWGDLEWVQ